MNELTAIQAYDLLRFAASFEDRLGAAQRELEMTNAGPREQGWLADAIAVIGAEKDAVQRLLDHARKLPELTDARLELADELQEKWVDALEKLLAGITFHSSARDPVIEAIFPHQKFPALRRANRETVEHFANELERRLKTAYVTRILSQDTYAFAPAVIEQLRGALAEWNSCFTDGGLPELEASSLRRALASLASTVDLAMQQAKLLAQAALLPTPGRFDELGLGGKPRKRTVRGGDVPVAPAQEAIGEGAAGTPEAETRSADRDEAAGSGPSNAGTSADEAALATDASPVAPGAQASDSTHDAASPDGANPTAAHDSTAPDGANPPAPQDAPSPDGAIASAAASDTGSAAAPRPRKRSSRKAKAEAAPTEEEG